MEEFINYLKSFSKERDKGIRRYTSNFVYSHNGYEMHAGATRICVTHEDWDFVLKFDEKFNTTAYCALELYHYEMAKNYRVQQVLLPISKVFTFDYGLKVYQQEKISSEWDTITPKEAKALKKSYKQMCESNAFNKITHDLHYGINSYWIARTIQLYGKKFMHSLVQWIDDYDINDLHNGNIGLLNKRPIILDYAGFRGVNYSPSKEILENY